MLAKETKIYNLIIQRNFIKLQLDGINKEGDPSYRYVGYLYPENRKYFEEEGYDVTIITSMEALQITQGLPLNIFTPAEEIVLTDEEILSSEKTAIDIAKIIEDLDTILDNSFSTESDEESDEMEEDEVVEEEPEEVTL